MRSSFFAGPEGHKLWAHHPRRLTYDEAFALCALGSRIIYIDTGGYYTATALSEVVTAAHENGVSVFWEAKEYDS